MGLWFFVGEMLARRRVSVTSISALTHWFNYSFVSGVLLLSTCHSDEFVVKTNYKGEERPIPSIISYYNKAKTPVDLSDQKAAASTPHRKLHKWYQRLAIELLLNTAVINAFVIFKEQVPTRNEFTVPEYREKLADFLMGIKPTPAPRQASTNHQGQVHVLKKLAGNSKKMRRTCKLCYQKISTQVNANEARNKARKSKFSFDFLKLIAFSSF